MKKIVLPALCALIASFASAQVQNLSLWYKQAAQNWNQALPVGNGRMGAMIFGEVEKEHIQLNEESLWAGKQIDDNNPGAATHLHEIQQLILSDQQRQAYELMDKYMLATPARFRSYQTLGDLYLDFGQQGDVTNYSRSLDLATGIVTVIYNIDSVRYKREIFASAPDNVIVMRITSNKPGGLSCKVTLSREKDASVTASAENTLEMNGQLVDVSDKVNGEGGPGMKFHAILKAKQIGGSITTNNNSLLVQHASEMTIVLTAATDYAFSKLNFDRSINPITTCQHIISALPGEDGELLKQRHLGEYQPLFSRVNLQLGEIDKSPIPTDERLELLKKGGDDPQLTALYFQYARYLLLSSSRKPGVMPANLQGIWNKEYEAPWNADFHTNINIQMNYWPAEVCNLSETVTPLIDFIDYIRVPGRVTAHKMYNAQGWTMHHFTDAFGKTGIHDGVNWGTSPLAGAWLCLHLWEHYQFTLDKQFLREKAWPIMKEAAQFVQSFLIQDKESHLVTAPSVSPENSFKMPDGSTEQITYAPTIDIAIITSLYNACIETSNLLNADHVFAKSLARDLKKLPPIQVSKKYGTIQEWIHDYDEAEPGHRHMSQLFGLHPASLITPNTPELFAAAKKTIERRLQNGGGHTGWSRAWIINFYARLLDGEKAHDNVLALLKNSTLINLFDNHPPFQIDGNFGGAAGIAEMLLQSQNAVLQLLPALPKAWDNGKVSGICARGGFVVDIEWKTSDIIKFRLYSKTGGTANISYKNKTAQLKTQAGQWYELNKDFQWK